MNNLPALLLFFFLTFSSYGAPRPIRVLFLGHEDLRVYHGSAAAAVLMEKLGREAIYFDYVPPPEIELSVGLQKKTVTVQESAALEEYEVGKVGEISISKPGDLDVTLSSANVPGGFVMHLRSLVLVPKAEY
jgi:hypothetical protein